MEKTDKPLTRDALVSMQVIDAKGRLIGKVKDVAFAVGKIGIGLSVENEDGEIQSIGWEDVQAASDFIILKPVPQAQPQQQTQQTYQTVPQQQ
ncbi:MAG: PRC-barrel domain-containing protein, partial [Candidatus Bathyarchaeota archaeon]|nr:PRC-barrel domain-containing protein [Candidatus Bathyarchaeota archaeon]